MDILSNAVVTLLGLAGVGAFLSLLVNVGKKIGWVKDGQAAKVSAGLNLLALAGLYLFRVIKPDADWQGIDAQLGAFVAAVTPFIGYILQLFSAQQTHAVVTGLPVIGKSYSYDKYKALDAELGTTKGG